MRDNIFVVKGVPVNTIHIDGKRNTGKAISPEGIINTMENMAITEFVKIPEGRSK